MNKLQSYFNSTADALHIRCNCTSGPLPICCKTVPTLLKICFKSIENSRQNSPDGRLDFQKLHDQHWGIEQYHRMLKQVCNVERFPVRCCGQSRIDPRADDGLTQAKSLQSQCWQRFARLVHGSAESRHVGQKWIGANRHGPARGRGC